MKRFYDSLKKHAKNKILFEKKKNLLLTKEELKSYQQAEVCYICGKGILERFAKDRSYRKSGTIAIIQINIEAQHIAFVI